MATYTVKMPSGEVLDIDGPDGATVQQLEQAGNSHLREMRKTAGRMAVADMGQVSRYFAGAGAQMTDFGRGIGQALGLSSRDDVRQARELNTGLDETTAAKWGRFTGGVATTLPALAIPVANTVLGSAAIGTVLGALAPSESTGETFANAGFGVAAGGGGALVAKGVGRMVSPVRSSLGPEGQRLAQVAQQEGIPLDAAARTGSKPLQTMNAVFEQLPTTAGAEARKIVSRVDAFNAAALRRAGIDSTQATPDVLLAGEQQLGKQLGRVYSRNSLPLHGGLAFDLTKIAERATKRLGDDNAAPMVNFTQELIDEVAQRSPRAFKIPGERVQALREELRPLASGSGPEAKYWAEMRDALRDYYRNSLKPAQANKWDRNRAEFANLKVIEDAMGGAGMAPNAGNISPAQLSAALARSVGRQGKAVGRGDLNDVGRLGNLFVRDQVPNSGTAQRLLYQSLATGLPGYGYGLATTHDPIEALTSAGVAVAGGLVAPSMIRGLLNSGPAQAYLTQGLLNGRQIPANVGPLLRDLTTAASINLPPTVKTKQ